MQASNQVKEFLTKLMLLNVLYYDLWKTHLFLERKLENEPHTQN